ncbi:MAG: polyprenyl synthetase family protein [Muribaculaceae bacterium]|nr:polyprenyl synthetase family protein [Muribaculaceae bacterium]
MTRYDEIRHSVAPELERLNERIHARLTSGNALMDTIVGSQLRTRGKQIRPLVVVLCARMFGEVSERVLAAGASVELLHNASLIHDDVVDESRLRRGNPTVNAVWDNHISVLVGDFYTSSSLREAVETGDMRIIRTISDLGRLLSLGELSQIDTARTHTLTEEAYFNNIEKKTASLFVACARMGCYASDAPDDATEKLAEFARLLGLCFQIRDDVFDYYPAEKIGKPTGNDLREGKVTLPLLHVLLQPQLPGHAEMLELTRRDGLSDADIARLQAFARDNGGTEYAFDKMVELRARAAEQLAGLPAGAAADALLGILDYIISRDH